MDDVLGAARRHYSRSERSGGGDPANALQLFAFAARNILRKEEITVVTLDPDLPDVVPVFTVRANGPLYGRRMHLCRTNKDIPKNCDIWVASHNALFDTDLTPGFRLFVR